MGGGGESMSMSEGVESIALDFPIHTVFYLSLSLRKEGTRLDLGLFNSRAEE